MNEHDDDPGESHELPAHREPTTGLERPASAGAPPRYPDYPDAGFEEGGGPDWRRILEGLWRWKWLVLAATVLGVGAGVFLMQRADVVYETRATIWLGPSEQQQGPIKPADIFEGQGWADLMASQAVLEPVVKDERLFVSAVSGVDSTHLENLAITSELVPGTYRLTGDADGRFQLERADGQVVQQGRMGEDVVGEPVGFRWEPDPSILSSSEGGVRFRVVRPSDAAGQLRKRLQVGFNPQAGNLINTRLQWGTAEGAARLHNGLLDSFLQVAQRLKSQKLDEVVDILERQTEYAAARLDSAELALENFRVQTVTLPSEPQTTSLPQGGEATISRPGSNVFGAYFEQKLERDQLQSRVDDLRQILQTAEQQGELNVLSLRMNPATDRSAQLSRALEELTSKQAERRTMLQQYTEAYPPVQELDERIRSLQEEVIPGLVGNLIQQLETRIAELDRQLQNRASELRRVPTRSIRQAQLQREVEMAERLHTDLQSRLKNAELAARTNLPDLQVVDRATVPGSPAEDPGPRFFMLASLAGLGLGLGGSLLMDRLDDKVRYPDQVTEGIGLPMLGMVPRIPDPGRGSEPSQEVLESFRAIRGQITRAGGDRDSLYLVTSPSPREGKTLVVANLGISFANAGRRTLIVDGDTRKGNLERFFEAPPGPGLTDLLEGRVGLEEVEVATEFDGLTMIPHGKMSDFRPELLDGTGMDDFLRRVRGRYDVVLLDAPPLMAGADAMVMGERTDGVVFVLRTGETDREAARARLTGVGNFDLPVLGAVMNDVPARGRYYQYYYYSYQPAELEGSTAVVRT